MDDLSELEQMRANRYMAQRLNQEVRETIALSRATIAQQERIIKRLAFRLGVVSALLVVALVLLALSVVAH